MRCSQQVAHLAVERAHAELQRARSPGITLLALPAWNAPTVTTAICSGSTLRDTMVCSAITMLDAATTGIGRAVRHRAVAADAGERDGGVVRRGHRRRLRAATSRPCGMPGMLCIAKIASHGYLLEQAVVHHAQAPPPPSSAGWKIRFSVPSKRPRRGQVVRRGQQHRGVAVVAAGMHHAGVAARVGQAGGLVDRQRVHVGAQAEAARAVAAHQPCRPRRCRRGRARTS